MQVQCGLLRHFWGSYRVAHIITLFGLWCCLRHPSHYAIWSPMLLCCNIMIIMLRLAVIMGLQSTLLDVGRSILRVIAPQLWAAVKACSPCNHPNMWLSTSMMLTLLLLLYMSWPCRDSHWADIMNERNAFAAQEANRVEYNCVSGPPLCVQAVPGNGWYKAHGEQSSAHKAYMRAGQKWVDNRGRKKATTSTKAGSTKATSINDG